jgi:FkbM family methyltransferase
LSSHLTALLGVAFSSGPRPPIASLLRRPSLIERDFIRKSAVAIRPDGEFVEVMINGELLMWPATMNLAPLLRIVAEQSDGHPHRYDWGNTRVYEDDVVLDIGACEGSFSVFAASKGARIIAVEPSKQMTKLIKRLFERRNLKQPDVVNKLLGRFCGETWFCEDPINIAASTTTSVGTELEGSYPVEVTTLDALVASLKIERIDFIKCDAEGADVDILKGGEEALRRFHPRIAVTTYHADDHYHLLAEYLSGLGYSTRGNGYIYVHGKYRPVMLHAS